MASEVAAGILGLSKDQTPKKSMFIMAAVSLALVVFATDLEVGAAGGLASTETFARAETRLWDRVAGQASGLTAAALAASQMSARAATEVAVAAGFKAGPEGLTAVVPAGLQMSVRAATEVGTAESTAEPEELRTLETVSYAGSLERRMAAREPEPSGGLESRSWELGFAPRLAPASAPGAGDWAAGARDGAPGVVELFDTMAIAAAEPSGTAEGGPASMTASAD